MKKWEIFRTKFQNSKIFGALKHHEMARYDLPTYVLHVLGHFWMFAVKITEWLFSLKSLGLWTHLWTHLPIVWDKVPNKSGFFDTFPYPNIWGGEGGPRGRLEVLLDWQAFGSPLTKAFWEAIFELYCQPAPSSARRHARAMHRARSRAFKCTQSRRSAREILPCPDFRVFLLTSRNIQGPCCHLHVRLMSIREPIKNSKSVWKKVKQREGNHTPIQSKSSMIIVVNLFADF